MPGSTIITIGGSALSAGLCNRCGSKLYPAGDLRQHTRRHEATDLQIRRYAEHFRMLRDPPERQLMNNMPGIRNAVGCARNSHTWERPARQKMSTERRK